MVKVAEYEYDGGGVGDGNLTKATQFPGGGAADRVTQTWFDWRDRAVAVKAGVETSESTSVNRPLAYYRLRQPGGGHPDAGVRRRHRDPDASRAGCRNRSRSSLLPAQYATSFDELGRAYRQDVSDVDPSSGSVGSYTLYALTWFDSRGNVEKTLSPGGLVTKASHDGPAG